MQGRRIVAPGKMVRCLEIFGRNRTAEAAATCEGAVAYLLPSHLSIAREEFPR